MGEVIKATIDRGSTTPATIAALFEVGATMPDMLKAVAFIDTSLATPVLMSGPVATPSVDTCLVEWTVDVPAYHRVRYKKKGAAEWTVTDWTVTPTTGAAINLTGL